MGATRRAGDPSGCHGPADALAHTHGRHTAGRAAPAACVDGTLIVEGQPITHLLLHKSVGPQVRGREGQWGTSTTRLVLQWQLSAGGVAFPPVLATQEARPHRR